MSTRMKIGILGGDMRQGAVCTLFSLMDIECAIWGSDLQEVNNTFCNYVRTVDWRDTLKGATAVILPLPITKDGVRLNCGKSVADLEAEMPRITEIIQATERNTLLFGGKIPLNIRRFANEHNVKMIDYYESEEFQIKNAVPTAEGAIGIAIRELNITLSGSRCAVVGYGRIGRTLATRLISLGSQVTCIARSKRDLAWAECDGCNTLKLSEYKLSPLRQDVIFNTVPHMIFDSALFPKLDPGQLFIDLASMNGGIDVDCAEKHGIRVVKALSLPGKCSPITAGKIIFDSVCEYMKEEGIL